MFERITSLSYYVYFSAHNIIPVAVRGCKVVKVPIFKSEDRWFDPT